MVGLFCVPCVVCGFWCVFCVLCVVCVCVDFGCVIGLLWLVFFWVLIGGCCVG